MGAEARKSLFFKGRDEGLQIALRLVEAGGDAESIRKEIRFREMTGVSIGLSNEELDKASHRIKVLTVGTLKIAMAAAIADSYGFGQKRIRKAIDAFDKLTEYMDNGWVYWLDMVEELKARYHIDLSIEEGDAVLRHYCRPAPQDVWEEADFVRPEDWAKALGEAGLTQGVSKNGLPCVFDGPVPLIEYGDAYEQIEAFCMVQGIILERSRRKEMEFLAEAMRLREALAAKEAEKAEEKEPEEELPQDPVPEAEKEPARKAQEKPKPRAGAKGKHRRKRRK